MFQRDCDVYERLWRSAIVKEQLKARVTWAYFAGSILFSKADREPSSFGGKKGPR